MLYPYNARTSQIAQRDGRNTVQSRRRSGDCIAERGARLFRERLVVRIQMVSWTLHVKFKLWLTRKTGPLSYSAPCRHLYGVLKRLLWLRQPFIHPHLPARDRLGLLSRSLRKHLPQSLLNLPMPLHRLPINLTHQCCRVKRPKSGNEKRNGRRRMPIISLWPKPSWTPKSI